MTKEQKSQVREHPKMFFDTAVPEAARVRVRLSCATTNFWKPFQSTTPTSLSLRSQGNDTDQKLEVPSLATIKFANFRVPMCSCEFSLFPEKIKLAS